MRRTLGVFTTTLALLALLSPALAAKPAAVPTVPPEVEGLYDVAGRPGMKVRVFVHREHAKPAPSSQLMCGLTDPNGTAEVAGAGWKIPSGTWTYRVNPTVPASVSAGLSAIVANSFAAWTSIPVLSGVTLVRGADTSVSRAVFDGQNIVAWGRTSGSALGVTYIWYQNGIVNEVDTIMNNKFSWKWSDQASCAYTNTYDAQNILTHELGHWFGLDDEYDSATFGNHTMYGYGAKGEVKKNTLTTGDIAGISTIY